MPVDTNNSVITFSKIENGTIFTSDFRSFTERNTITFSKEGMAIIYGPNGAGKTSLVRVLSGMDGTNIEFEYCGVLHTSGDDVFTIINDQNHRNIIKGSPKDFLIGANIQREYDLQTYIDTEYLRLCEQAIADLKSKFSITSATNKAIDYIENKELVAVVKALANNKNKGKSISVDQFLQAIQSIKPEGEIDFNESTLTYFLKDIADKNSITMSVLGITIPGIKKTPKVREIEENTAALGILEHFKHKTQCIVCDTPDIDPEHLIEDKTGNRERVIASLNKDLQKLIEKVIALAEDNDPFSIKETLMAALDSGDADKVINLQGEIKTYGVIAAALIEKYFVELLAESKLRESFDEYQKLIDQKPDITEEDFLYIEEIISGSMRKELKIDRDEKKNIKIFLANNEFLGHDRDDLQLSSGEQNFLSLTFEFLRARNNPQPIVVLDDPISSFDSIYKNKVVYAIAKILENKKRIILTHNIDMIRLLDAQYKKSFKMYLLNNTENEINGFIPLKFAEQDMLINLSDLLNSFRGKVLESILDRELFLMAMIPFMRGYANICNNKSVYEGLTKVMHGYMTESVDIASMYHDLFDTVDDDGHKVSCPIDVSYTINIDEILKRSVDGHDIIDTNKYPLLNRTLKHMFVYLSLRLIVERVLVNKFGIDTSKYSQLGQIIDQAFSGDTEESKRMRVKLTSKKTLINEFNHFEGNLSIFQPAIDITDTALGKEKTEILSLVERIKTME
jgi:ABC-type lipoprotein export system ATPase subunit